MTLNTRSDPAFLRHYIRVLLREARARRHTPAFHATLMSWAANARADLARVACERPAQGDLFGRAA